MARSAPPRPARPLPARPLPAQLHARLPAPLPARLLARLLAPLLGALLGACHAPPPPDFPGYAEADYVRLASPVGGTLARSPLERGQQVAAGAPAFALEQESERAARLQAQAHVQRARAVLANLGKGRRPAELDVITAQLGEADAALRLARSDLERETALVARRFTAPARLDQLRAAVARAQAQVAGLRAQLQVARAAARPDELRAAEQDVHAAEAELAQANWKLDQKTVTVPVAAQVADVLYRPGELVPAGAPVVSLLVPAYVRARFFVPEAVLGRLRLGQPVTLRCDGCAAPLAATISYIAPQAEYTAPLIYSQENRADLVFLVEARPAGAGAAALHPGQPLAVRLADAAQGAR